jgi:hypothetical protein
MHVLMWAIQNNPTYVVITIVGFKVSSIIIHELFY